MKNLILMRHAKSSWDAPVQDFDRTLEHRGIEDAHSVARYSLNYLPSSFVIYSSSAKRARETALIFAKTILYPAESIVFSDNLYTFDAYKLEKVIKSIRNNIDNVIIFGHNDAITNFVNKFGNIFIDNVPTAGFVWIQFEAESWDTIANGKTIKTLFPKNLK
ncbi:SixA phosphatase family protein [Flavobacterium nackdongense]|uniref:Histidine phosphatase family protein n=1 Tax=Flavobacterium nackdongense TaxID=2547394 RepID=A0A4V1AG99_9FLAO|nr:histidine phosphatase family protein [Flavobacterium nackdongense]QBN17302.1 histidine phosphatase family protein [Flavobacterium nackdongense]